MGLLDFVFPKRCVSCKKLGAYVCANCFSKLSFSTKSLCLICGNPSYNNLTHPNCLKKYTIDGCFSAISYNGVAQKLIYSFKYKPFISDLNNTLIELFYESIIQNENFIQVLSKEKFILVPIPLFSKKLKKRGYNQSEILAKSLSKILKIPIANLLTRTKDTKNQFKLSKDQRGENIKQAFKVIKNVKNLNILLVDDIVTTGATLKEAANVLKRNGAKKVFGLTFARD